MSGGHWNYNHYKIQEYMQEIGNDGEILKRFPKLAQIFHNCGELIVDVAHKLDYDLSSDSSIEDDEQFEIDFINQLSQLIKRPVKCKIYHIF